MRERVGRWGKGRSEDGGKIKETAMDDGEWMGNRDKCWRREVRQARNQSKTRGKTRTAGMQTMRCRLIKYTTDCPFLLDGPKGKIADAQPDIGCKWKMENHQAAGRVFWRRKAERDPWHHGLDGLELELRGAKTR